MESVQRQLFAVRLLETSRRRRCRVLFRMTMLVLYGDARNSTVMPALYGDISAPMHLQSMHSTHLRDFSNCVDPPCRATHTSCCCLMSRRELESIASPQLRWYVWKKHHPPETHAL